MTTTARGPAHTATSPATRARIALWSVAAVLVVITETSLLVYGEGKNSILTVAKFFGLHAAMLMMLQLTLIARVPWLDRRIGMDRLTAWHRWVGIGLAWTVLTHATLIISGYAALDGVAPWETWLALAGVPASLLGMGAAAVVVLLVVSSLRFVRRRLSYEAWHALHVGLYAAVVLALVHQFWEPASFKQSPVLTAVWVALWTLVLGLLVVNRFVVPLRRNALHRYEVSRVVPESDDVVSVHVTGRHLDRLPARAGQFMIWRFPAHGGWWQANPFSLSAAPDGTSLRLTAKAVGSTSASLRTLPVGTRVFAEGPYGAFTAAQRTGTGMLLIAGGVGVTPIRALLEEAAMSSAAGVSPGAGVSRGVAAAPGAAATADAGGWAPTVLYRVRTADDAVLLEELTDLASRLGGRVHVLAGRTGEGSPPNSFEPEHLLELVPDVVERDVFVCGPPPMTAAVLDSLERIGVPRSQVHSERFRLA